jgi:hypothetical protein
LGEQKKESPLGLPLSHFLHFLVQLFLGLIEESVKVFEHHFWFDSEFSSAGRAGKEKV